jgi:hypothetical protein
MLAKLWRRHEETEVIRQAFFVPKFALPDHKEVPAHPSQLALLLNTTAQLTLQLL